MIRQLCQLLPTEVKRQFMTKDQDISCMLKTKKCASSFCSSSLVEEVRFCNLGSGLIYHSVCHSAQRRSISCMLLLFRRENESDTTQLQLDILKYFKSRMLIFGGLLVKTGRHSLRTRSRSRQSQWCLSVSCPYSQRRRTIRSVEKKKKQIKTWTETPTPTTQDK